MNDLTICKASFIAAISELYDFVLIARLNHNLLTSKKIINSICKSLILIIFSLLYGLKGVGMGILSGEFLNVVYSFYILKSLDFVCIVVCWLIGG